jgi:hypothetical protein
MMRVGATMAWRRDVILGFDGDDCGDLNRR